METKRTKMGPVKVAKCSRCNGTGDWAPGRVCFQCNGRGEVYTDTPEAAYNRKLAHVEEVRGIIIDLTARVATVRWGKAQLQKDLDTRKAQLVQLEAELASMKLW